MASSTENAAPTMGETLLVAEGSMATNHSDNAVGRFMPYYSPLHQPTKARYITSNDSRGYM